MIDLNHILLFIAIVSPLVLLARTWRGGAESRSWRIAALSVLTVTAATWMIAPSQAGWWGGTAWLLWLLIPILGLRKAEELAWRDRFAAARWLAELIRFLHPSKAFAHQKTICRALQLAQRAQSDAALALLAPLAHDHTSAAARHAIVESLRIRGDWDGLLAQYRALTRARVLSEPAFLPIYFRALGESGAVDEMVLQFAARAPALLATPQLHSTCHAASLPLLAFCGRTSSLARLFETRFRGVAPDTKEFWLGTSEVAAGAERAGRARLERLRARTRDALIRASADRRLAQPKSTSPPRLAPATERLLRPIEQHDGTRPSTLAFPRARPTIAVLILIALNLAMFTAENLFGGATDYRTLHRLGALEPYAIFSQGEYWRLLTALFLHYGVLHLAFNAYALFVLGPPLETFVGALRFALVYLIAGLGSSAGVVGLWSVGWSRADQLVGASGSIMGVIGAWAALLLSHRHMPMAGRRLGSILLIVAMQIAFDLFTPQVSMAAHLSGFASGLLAGVIIAPHDRSAVSP